jgi:methanogenic corrinoid protein MtbC1
MPTPKRGGLPATQTPFWSGLLRKGIAMTDFFPGLDRRADPEVRGERAVMPFLQLGEKLKQSKAADGHPESREILIKTIEGEIIPRLMLTLADAKEKDVAVDDGVLAPSEEERAEFLWSVMNESATSSRAFVTGLIGRGVPREAIYLDLLTGAARRLGEMWERDEADFTDVTIGLCRLHQILREQGAFSSADLSGTNDSPSILLATSGGDQHVFGVVMVSEFFRRAGWRVWSDPAASIEDLKELVARERFDVIGLSAACDAPPEAIATEISDLRAASSNPAVAVLVGGGLFNKNPELVEAVGADATAADGKAAVELGRRLVVTALQRS